MAGSGISTAGISSTNVKHPSRNPFKGVIFKMADTLTRRPTPFKHGGRETLQIFRKSASGILA